jgi:hypothetical protein
MGFFPPVYPSVCLNRESSASEFNKPHATLKPEACDVSGEIDTPSIQTLDFVFDPYVDSLSRTLNTSGKPVD